MVLIEALARRDIWEGHKHVRMAEGQLEGRGGTWAYALSYGIPRLYVAGCDVCEHVNLSIRRSGLRHASGTGAE